MQLRKIWNARIRTNSDLAVFVISISCFASVVAQTIDWLLVPSDILEQTWGLAALTAFVIAAPVTFVVGRRLLRVNQLQDALQRKLAYDALTGLLTRHELTAREYGMTKTEGVVLIKDIDRFKRINDTCGHMVGDDVLREVARVLLEKSREADVVCRFGGEEFLIFLPNTTVFQGLRVADQMRVAISRAVAVDINGVRETVTISGGLVHKPAGVSLGDVLHEADEALYHAKNTGRNRVCAANMAKSGVFVMQGAKC